MDAWKSAINCYRKSSQNFVFGLYIKYNPKEYLRRGTHQEFPSNILGYECYDGFLLFTVYKRLVRIHKSF